MQLIFYHLFLNGMHVYIGLCYTDSIENKEIFTICYHRTCSMLQMVYDLHEREGTITSQQLAMLFNKNSSYVFSYIL